MPLRTLGRYDALLLAGFTMALLVIFSRPIRTVLEAARDFENAHGLSLLPALVILTVVFLFQQLAKRQELAMAATASAAEAREATRRAEQLEELVRLGRSLAEALDLDAVREAAWRHLPVLAGRLRCWALVVEPSGWEILMGVPRLPDGAVGSQPLVRVAETMLNGEGQPTTRGGLIVDGQLGFPMRVGGVDIGVLGVDLHGSSPAEQSPGILAAAATLLGVAVKNVQLFAEIRDTSMLDGLTGCFTHRYTQQILDSELGRAARSGLPFSVVMFDLDAFKPINDRHGHLAGNAVLAAVGRQLGDVLRVSDIKCRYGGEEFLILLPDTPPAGARRVAESLRQAIAELSVQWEGQVLKVTASFGVASAAAGERDRTALISRADRAMYLAKRSGRNRVCVGDGPVPVPAHGWTPVVVPGVAL